MRKNVVLIFFAHPLFPVVFPRAGLLFSRANCLAAVAAAVVFEVRTSTDDGPWSTVVRDTAGL